MAKAEVRTITRQGAPGTDPVTDYELGATIDGVWLAFSRLDAQALESARAGQEADQRAQEAAGNSGAASETNG